MSKWSKKNMSAYGYTGYQKEHPSYGKMREKLELICEMPEVGDIVEMYDKAVYCGRGEYRGSDRDLYLCGMTDKQNVCRRRYTYMTDYTGTRSERGIKKRYKVVGFTLGRDKPASSGNKILLDCVYPPSCVGLHGRMTVPTVHVAVGYTFIKVVGHEDPEC